MNAVLARLLGQAETNLVDAARRTVDIVTTPIVLKTQTIATETMAAATRTAKVVLIKAVLGLIAVGMGLVAVVYLLSALYQALLPILGPVETRLALAGAFALIAVVAVLAIVFWPTGKAQSRTPHTSATSAVADARLAMAKARSADADADASLRKATAAAAPDDTADRLEAAGLASDLTGHFDAIVDVLGEAGFHREKAGLRAGLALARQLKPMQIVALALIGGFIAGVRR